MNDAITKKDLVEALANLATKDDLRVLEKSLETKFATKDELNGAVEAIMDTLGHLQESIDDLKPYADLVEKHDRRIETTEKRTAILKNVIEKDLNTPVAW